MIIEPRCRGFICTTAHPMGCRENVRRQLEYALTNPVQGGAKRALILGASTGYGLASRIAAAGCMGASTFGVSYEREGGPARTASAGYYNNAAFEEEARGLGLYAESVNGDAFTEELKREVAARLLAEMGPADLVVYSLAAPRRTDPATGETYRSVLLPIGAPYSEKTVDFHSGAVSSVTLQPATEDEIRGTVKVMGAEDWRRWIEVLAETGALADGVRTVAYSYIGPELTHAVYKNGTIGRAKEDMERAAKEIGASLAGRGGRAFVSVNKAVVTQASAAIPVVPLYMAILFKVMKAKGLHEDCIEQAVRLIRDRLYAPNGVPVDEAGRIRLDDWEMRDDVQSEVARLWPLVDSENIAELTDLAGYRTAFFNLFGFEVDGVDYSADVPLI